MAEKLLDEAAARGCNRAIAFKAVRVNEYIVGCGCNSVIYCISNFNLKQFKL